MDYALLANLIHEKLPGLRFVLNEPMSRHTSFHIGGPAAIMAFPASASELAALCELAQGAGVKPFVFGNGTNLLVQDAPLEILAIKTCDGLSAIELIGDDKILAGSGALLSKTAVFAQKNGLTGLEFAHGIPGTLGGAVSMNAGAYGGEMKLVVSSTEFLDEDYKKKIATGSDHGFEYRHSVFSDTEKIIISSVIQLSKGEPMAIKKGMNEFSEKRRASQPLDLPSAGSAFKRPKGGYAAALIDEAGLKGYSIGGAQVSEKHAGFIVNRGGASCDDVLGLIKHIKETVYKKSGITLETEIKYISG